MSWSIEITGSKEGVVQAVAEQLGHMAANYEGSEEARDIVLAKDRILALIGALELGKDSYGVEWNGIRVVAKGSQLRSGSGIVSANFDVLVVRTNLAL
jgi:hypothetical protein